MTQKTYVMALKYGLERSAPPDWKDRLRGIDGVSSVTGNLSHRAQFTATPQAAEEVKAAFSNAFHIEEAAGRSPS